MKAVLLVNMGSPSSEKEMKVFLERMFRDKSILNVNPVLRYFLSFLISSLRYKKSWRKYQVIGGSPLIQSMNAIRAGMEKSLPEGFIVQCAFSYSEPGIGRALQSLSTKGVTDFIVLPMYPHNCFSTSGSIVSSIEWFKKKNAGCSIKIISNYFASPGFISYWEDLIKKHIAGNNYSDPYLLFSAHSVPEYQVANGDTYTSHIAENARLLAEKLQLGFSVGYQSKIGRLKWFGPDTYSILRDLHRQKVEQVVIVPISFVNENLETLYDIDLEMLTFARKLGFKQISRVTLPHSHQLLTNTFKELIFNKL
ncbi:MAG: ferrochelatase [Bacteroidales bacterium]|nr:ferrochelatase [Bacteroidales bacterium]